MVQQKMQSATFQPLPMEVAQQAEMYQMGAFTAIYKPHITNPLLIILMAIAAIVIDIVLFIIILNTGWIVYILVVIPFLAIYYAIKSLINANLRIYTFANGFLRAKGSAIDVIRYDQVMQVFFTSRNGSYGTTFHTLTTVRNDGVTFKFTSLLKNIATLGEIVQSEVTQRHMPLATDTFKRGSILPFGPLSVSQQGINKGRATLPLNAIQSIALNRGYVVIKQIGRRSAFAKVRVVHVPNMRVFFNIVNYARNGQ